MLKYTVSTQWTNHISLLLAKQVHIQRHPHVICVVFLFLPLLYFFSTWYNLSRARMIKMNSSPNTKQRQTLNTTMGAAHTPQRIYHFSLVVWLENYNYGFVLSVEPMMPLPNSSKRWLPKVTWACHFWKFPQQLNMSVVQFLLLNVKSQLPSKGDKNTAVNVSSLSPLLFDRFSYYLTVLSLI